MKIDINILPEHKEILHEMNLNQYKNINRVKINRGHILFEFNFEDKTLKPADVTIETKKNEKEIEYKQYHTKFNLNCIYIPALNLKNAVKKLNNTLIYVYITANTRKREAIANPEQSASSFLQGDKEDTEIKTDNNT